MVTINKEDYLERTTSKSIKRDWWFVKDIYPKPRGYISLGLVYFPKELIGKRVKFKVEIIK